MNKKSIWAVIAGILFVIIVTTVVDIALYSAGILPHAGQPLSNSLALLATAYRIVIGVLGGWLTARLAPDRPMKHALILGIIGTALGLVGVVVTWNQGLGPRWYAIAIAVLAIPQCWAGARLYAIGKPSS